MEEAGCLSGELLPERGRAMRVTRALDRINDKYGNNTLYFGSMGEAIRRDAAPMRIPFSTIPDIQRDEEGGAHGALAKPDGSDHELWLLRERQFKVLAETAHRESRAKPHERDQDSPRMGAGGWHWRASTPMANIERGQTLPLFR